MSGRLLPMIDPESKNPSRSDDASPATYGIKGFGAKAGESGINGFQAFIYCTIGQLVYLPGQMGLAWCQQGF